MSAALAAPLSVDRAWQVLAPPIGPDGPRKALAFAAEQWGNRTLELAGIPLTGERLAAWAESPPEEPLLRTVREDTRRPIDLADLLRLLDDVLAADLPDDAVLHVPTGRARTYGLLVHVDDAWKDRPRDYPRYDELHVDRPEAPTTVEPARDGDPPGPGWTARYLDPTEREPCMAALVEARPESGFAERVEALLDQLEAQGAEVWVTSTVRSRHRGYLMWGAFVLSRSTDEASAAATRSRLERANADWGLEVPISWWHPDGWQATMEAARTMAEAYDVVYATERGARASNHYDGVAVDFVAYGLPRSLTLTAPDGASETFDLSDPSEPRDLSLSPAVVRWVERHFALRKLVADHPHWNDARS